MTAVRDVLAEYQMSEKDVRKVLGILNRGHTAHNPCTGIGSIFLGDNGYEITEYDNAGRENIRIVDDI